MKNLSEYIDKVKNADVPEFPFNDNEIGEIISNTQSLNIPKRKLFNKNGIVTMGILSIFLVIGFYFFGIETSHIEKMSLNSQINNSKKLINEHDFTEQSDNFLMNEKETQESNVSGIISDNDEEEYVVYDLHPTDSSVSYKAKGIKEYLREQRDISFLIHPFWPTDEEWLKLGITKGNRNLIITTESYYNTTNESLQELVKKGYPEAGIFRKNYSITTASIYDQILKYEAWDMEKSSISAPVYMYCLKKTGKTISDTIETVMGSTYFTDHEINKKCSFELRDISRIYLNTLIEYTGEMKYITSLTLQLSSERYPLTKYFTPFITAIAEKRDTLLILLWYAVTNNLLSILDSEKSDFFRRTHIISDKLNLSSSNYPSKDNIVKNDKKQEEIQSVTTLELTTEELRNIGIDINRNKCYLQFESLFNLRGVPDSIKREISPYGYNIMDSLVLYREKLTLDSIDFHYEPVSYTGWRHSDYSQIRPIMITGKGYKVKYLNKPVYFEAVSDFSPLLDTNKKYWKMSIWGGESYKPSISRLLPVHFTVGDSGKGKKNFNEYDVWFLVTREFADLLPDRYRIPIKKELNIVDDVENGKIDIEDACNAIKGETSYFGLCSFSGQYIKNFAVYPNPATDKVRINFTVIRESQLSISLFCYTGAFISTIKTGNYITGSYSEEYLLTGLKEGVYLIVIADNTGDKVVRNFIIRK